MAFDLPADVSAGAPPAAIVAPAAPTVPQIHGDSGGFHYVVNNNTLLPEATVKAAIEGGRDQKDVLDRLNAQYQARGYFLTVLRAETVGKLVAISVINGQFTELDVAPGLVPYFTGVERRPDIDRNTIIRKTALAELYSARQGMRPAVSFSAAQEVGGSKITVVEEPIPGAKPWSAGLSFGNLGSRFSSRYTASAQGSVDPGGGLELSAGYVQGLPGMTPDSGGSQYQSAALGASLVTPWGLYGFNYSGIAYKIGDSAAPLFPDGDIKQVAISGTQLALADEGSRLTFTESFNHVDNVVTVFDGAFLLTQQQYSFVAAGLSYNRQIAVFGQSGSFTAGMTVQQGLTPRRGSFVPAGPGVANPTFSIIQANYSQTQTLPAGFSIGFNISGQYSDTTVPQNQQWVLGGYGNLTAWLPAVAVGDSGALGSLKLTTPAYSYSGYSLTGTAFVEAGLSRLHFQPIGDPATRTLADAGISLTGSTSFGTLLSMAYAWPIASRNVDLDRINAQGRANLYFTLSQTF